MSIQCFSAYQHLKLKNSTPFPHSDNFHCEFSGIHSKELNFCKKILTENRKYKFNDRKSFHNIQSQLRSEVDMRELHQDKIEDQWLELDANISFLTRTVRLVQWYPGHIAKAERDLKEQLKLVDVVIEVRDARIPQSTTHPDIDVWIGGKPKLVVLNREDMVSASDRNAWSNYYSKNGTNVLFTDGQHGSGILKLTRVANSVGKDINEKRKKKGLLPRAVRAAVVGFPNVGKSAIINRLLKKRIADSAPRPGVTRHVKWHQIGENLDLLDAPGILPARIADQSAAAKLAICNDIGEASYAVSGIALILIEYLSRMPSAGPRVLSSRYKLSSEGITSEEYLALLGETMFNGDIDQASHRVLKDFRRGAFGWLALERPNVD